MENLSLFLRTVDGIYGTYLDSVSGLVSNQRQLVMGQESIQMMARANPELANMEYLDQLPYIYSNVDPSIPNAPIQHRCTQGQFKKRNGKGGLNHKIISQMCVVVLYQYWEGIFRGEIAREFGKNRNDIQEPVMGDLRIFRNSIIHHAGIAGQDIKKCKVLKWFAEGDEIFLDLDKMDNVIREIKEMIKRLED